MADYYVWSGATGSATGADWTNAFTTIGAGASAAGAGDTIYVHYAHSETLPGNTTWTGVPYLTSGTMKIIAVDKDNSDAYTPQTSSPNVSDSSGYNLDINDCFEFFGIYFKPGNDLRFFTASDEAVYLQDCTIDTSGASGNVSNFVSDGYIYFKDCTFTGGSNGSYYFTRSRVDCVNCTFSTSHSNGIKTGGRNNFIGCDFSGVSSATTFQTQGYDELGSNIIGCILPSSAVASSTSVEDYIRFYESDSTSGNSILRNEKYSGGSRSVLVSTGVYRSGGATYDGTNEYSYLINGNTNYVWTPTYTDWGTGYISSTGSTTFTVYIANNTADYDNDEIWLEVEYFGASANTKKTVASNRISDPLDTPSTNTDDTSSTWTGTTLTYKQSLAVTVTVNRVGSFRWRVGSAVATDIYVCPAIDVA